MPAKVKLPALFQKLTGGSKEVESDGTTLGQIVDDLESRYPGMKARIIEDVTGELQPFVTVYLNDEDVRFLKEMDTPVTDGDTILILPAIAGG